MNIDAQNAMAAAQQQQQEMQYLRERNAALESRCAALESRCAAPGTPVSEPTCKYCGGTGYFRWQDSANKLPCPCVGCYLPRKDG